MNTDIRLSVSFKGHRKRKKFKMLLDHPSATDFLIDLWITVAVDRPDGSLAGLDSLDICLMAGWEGDCTHFVEALTAAGFIDNTEKGCYYPVVMSHRDTALIDALLQAHFIVVTFNHDMG